MVVLSLPLDQESWLIQAWKEVFRFGWNFVNKFVNWSLDLVKVVSISLDWTWYPIKWQSTSICFVLSCNTGFAAICIAAWLSQWRVMGALLVIARSFNKAFNQINSQVVDTIALYYAPALDLATTFCFLLFHVTRFPPMNVCGFPIQMLACLIWITISFQFEVTLLFHDNSVTNSTLNEEVSSQREDDLLVNA